MEIIALSSKLVAFILAQVLERDTTFSIAQSVKFKNQYGLSVSLDYCNFFFTLRDRGLDKYI
jgi:hypothetical protein